MKGDKQFAIEGERMLSGNHPGKVIIDKFSTGRAARTYARRLAKNAPDIVNLTLVIREEL